VTNPTLYVVHCVDTEGPLDETLGATFERIKAIYGLDFEPTPENLLMIQGGQGVPRDPELSGELAEVFSPENLNYNRTLEDLDEMNDVVFSDDYRSRFVDDAGETWRISWFCMDHLSYPSNPRNKRTGLGEIHDYYKRRIELKPSLNDEIQFHFHPRSIGNDPISAATSYGNSYPELLSALAFRLINFGWFPVAFRPGFHSIRPDSHLFLEQWFPLDFSNQFHEDETSQPDLKGGRFGDWRFAPSSWRGYLPSLTDYQRPGGLRRRTFRCLNLGTRHRLLTKDHVREAFAEATELGAAILAFTDHDFRDIKPDIEKVNSWIDEVRTDFSPANVRFATASEVGRIFSEEQKDIKFVANLRANRLEVTVTEGTAFSHQPFLAIKTTNGSYLSDNFDRGAGQGEWHYTFDEMTFPLVNVDRVGVAMTGENASVHTVVIDT
jgi:hypothetical protein